MPLIVNTGFDKSKGNAAIAAGGADTVAFGVPYIANPDLVQRLRQRCAAEQTRSVGTFYGESGKGYTDYPALAEVEAA